MHLSKFQLQLSVKEIPEHDSGDMYVISEQCKNFNM